MEIRGMKTQLSETWEDGQGNKITIAQDTIILTNGSCWEHIGLTARIEYSCKRNGSSISVDAKKSNGKELELVFTGVKEDILRVQGEAYMSFRRIW
jgi:hypothetical protein